ncbi:hypothetical protein GO755_32230 [Spirosoma sp. HMF4905]|uniref:Uncharacterized protein n=1 Tax=Spirosoma arboris TaxID=2682092 RepID=A0A7K1SLR0_9BACT|nr:hypothetical protein [Spirosoma arboris]MVM34741.1 hypothetical protein [Spirosoma arboris]
MTDTFDELTPDESLRADNQIKLLKLELEHNVLFESFDEATPPEEVSDFLDGILALEEMQRNPKEITVYDKVGRPPFLPEIDLSDNEVAQALDTLLRQMGEHRVALDILAPDDYDDRTMYRFVTDELFAHETTDLGGGWTTNFIYEEFHPNHRYDIINHCHDFIRMLSEERFDTLDHCLDDRFFDRDTELWSSSARPEVTTCLTELIESWWPRTLREGSVSEVTIADDTETA